MTKFFVDAQGNFLGGFDGALPPPGAIEVPGPPSSGLDIWNGVIFVPHMPTQSEINAQAKANLASIDLASIRALREYIAAKPDAPQILKDKEAAAVAERGKIK